ncbi:MAG: putative transcriptional regulator, contains an and PUA-like domain [Blastococcus sp.]|nr:putative transcriptional regulator, contains an and PUA-like domain [Blastococcus sp.]
MAVPGGAEPLRPSSSVAGRPGSRRVTRCCSELAGIEEHADLSGITADYLGGCVAAVALQLDAVHRLPEPVPLAALGLDRPPRSYRRLSVSTPLPAGVRDGLAALRRPG